MAQAVFRTLSDGRMVYADADYTDAELNRMYGAAPPPRPTGTRSNFGDDLQRGIGGAASTAGSALRDIPATSEFGAGLERWGNKVVENNPADYNTLADIHNIGDVFAAGGEVVTTMLPQIAGTVGAGALAAAAAPGAAAAVGAGALGAGAFGFGSILTDEYGGARQSQREQGIDDKGRALLSALPAAALEVIPGFGIGGRIVRRLGAPVAAAAIERAGSSFLGRTARTAVEQAGTEVAQTAMQRYGGYQSLTDAEAFDQYGMAAFGGAAGGGVLGGVLGGRRTYDPPAVAPLEPGGERSGPVSLLALPGPETISPRPTGPTLFADADGVTSENPAAIQVSRAAEPGADLYRRMTALEAQPEGAQADWVAGGYELPVDEASVTDAAPADIGTGQPELAFPASSTVANDFDTTRITRILRGPGKVDSFVAKTAPRLATAFKTNDVGAAQAALDDATETLQADAKLSPATVEARRAVLERAQLVVDTFKSRLADAFNQEATTQREVAPTPATVAVDPAPVEPAVQGYAPTDVTARNEAMAATDVDRRAQLLQRAVSTSRVRNVEGLFQRLLEREKLDTTVSDEELGQLIDAMDQRQAMDAEAATRDEAAAQTSTADIEAQIPERMAQAALPIPEIAEVAEPAAMAEATETPAQEVAQIAAPAVSARQQAMADMAAERTAPATVAEAVDTTATEKLIETAFDRKEIVPTQFTQLKRMLEAKAPTATVEAALDAARAQTAQTLARYSKKRWEPKPDDLIVEHNGKPLNLSAMDDLFQRLRAELTYKGFGDAAFKLVTGDDVRTGQVKGLEPGRDGSIPSGHMAVDANPRSPDFGRRILRVVADPALAGREMKTLNHEIVHLARDLDVWTPAEWSTLESWARTQKTAILDVDRAYAEENLTDEQTLEEVIAEAYADWEQSRAPVPPQIRTLFQKFKDFLTTVLRTIKLLPPAQKTQLRNYLSFSPDVDTIFSNLSSGAIGDRPRPRFNISRVAAAGMREQGGSRQRRVANPTRRDILAGAAVAGIATAADAATPKVSTVGRDVVMRAIDSGSLQKTVEAVRDTTKNEGYREVARLLALGGLGPSKVTKQVTADPDRLFPRYGSTDTVTGDVTLYQDTEISGLTEETILHEALHAFMAQRVGSVSVHSVPANREKLKSAPTTYDKFEENFVADWRTLSDVLEKKFPAQIDDANPDYDISLREAWRDPDELFTRIFTDPKLKGFLQGIDKNGYKVRKGQPSWWSRLMDTLFGWLGGRTKEARTAFDHIMSSAMPTLKSAVLLKPDSTFVRGYRDALRTQNSAVRKDQLAGPMRRAASAEVKQATKTIADEVRGMVGDKPARYASALMLGPSLTDFARRVGLRSALAYDRLVRAAGRKTGVINERATELAAAYAALPTKLLGTGEGTLNSLAETSTRTGKWAFEPDWLDEEDLRGRKPEVDPDLAARLQAMGPKAEAVMREMFRLPHETFKQKKLVLDKTIQHTADDEIKAAEAAGDVLEVARLKAQLNRARDHYRTLNDVDMSKPYASLQRSGDKVVVARSSELMAAEEAAKEGDKEAAVRVEEMKGDPAHYFFDAFDGNGEQARVARALEKRPEFTGNVDMFTKSDDEYLRAGGVEMMTAFRRLSTMLEDAGVDVDTRSLQRLLTDMYLRTLSSSSSRKAELRRLGVDSMPLDIMQNVINQARSDAHAIGAMSTVGEKTDVLAALKREARDKAYGRTTADKMAAYTEIMKREAASMEPPERNALVDNVLAATSSYMLTTSPSYFIQNALQNQTTVIPQLAAEHGYAKAQAALLNGYKEVKKAWSKTPLAKPLNFDALDPRMAELGHYLQDEGQLDVGINQDLGNIQALSANPVSQAATTVFSKLRAMVRLIEATGRYAAGVAAFDLALKKGSTAETLTDPGAYDAYVANRSEVREGGHVMTPQEFAAAQHARKIISLAHGIYSPHAKPRFMNSPIGKVATQFRVFQILQLTLWADAIQKVASSTTDPAEKLIAKRALGFMLAHTAVLAGGLGLPGMAMFKALVEGVINMFGGDDDEPADLERTVREAVKDPGLANLLLYGAPALAGLDLSGSLGSSTILSVAPYADPVTDRQSLANYFTSVFGGPSVAGVGMNYADGINLMARGSYYKGLEKFMPKGVTNVMRAAREATEGRTNRSGDVTRAPEEVDAMQTLYTALGLRTAERANEQWALNTEIERRRFQKDKTSRLKRDYAEAVKDGNSGEMARLRREWQDLQANKPQAERQPLSELLKAPVAQRKREQATVGGVQYSSRTRQRAEELAALTGLDEEPE